MNPQEVYNILLDKVNKLSSNGNSLLYPHIAARTINEAVYYWYDRRLREAEKDLTVQREVSPFIVSTNLIVSEINDIYNSYILPDDFYLMNQLRVLGSNGSCSHYLDTLFIENNNIQEYYLNDLYTPDFGWQQTLASLKGGNLIVYKKDFGLSVEIDYYRTILPFDIKSDYVHIDGTPSRDLELEFSNSNAYEIINLAAMLITGNLTDPQYQVHMNNIKQFE